MSLPESLKHVMLFAGLDDRARESFARLATDRRTPAGYLIFREGEAFAERETPRSRTTKPMALGFKSCGPSEMWL